MKLLIKDHHISLFYFINKEANLACLDHSKLVKIGLPDDLLDKWITNTSSKHAKKQLWKQIDNYNLSAHLNDNIHQLFHTEDTQQIIKTYTLTNEAVNLLNGKQIQKNASEKSFQLLINCNNASQKRLKSVSCTEQPQLEIKEIYYHQFKTGSGVACINLQLSNKQLTIALINEAVYKLSKINTLCWEIKTGQATVCNTQTTLGKIIRQLLDNEEDFKRTRRVYTNTYIQFFQQPKQEKKTNKAKDIDKQQKDLIRLARHRSLDYAISDEMIKQSIIFKDYENIRHCISREGMASFILIDNNCNQFLQNYYQGVIKQAHIPLYLLAFHAREVIQTILDKQIIWQPDQAIKTADIETLQNRKKQLLNLNRTFFLDVISDEEIHNKLHQALIQTNHLQNQYKKAFELTDNTLKVIEDHQKQQQQKEVKKAKIEYCKIAKVGVALATIPTAYSFFSEIPPNKSWLTNGISLLFAFILGSLVYIAINKYCQKADEPLD